MSPPSPFSLLFFDYQNAKCAFPDILFSPRFFMVAVRFEGTVFFLVANKGIITHTMTSVRRFMTYKEYPIYPTEALADQYFAAMLDVKDNPVSRWNIFLRVLGLTKKHNCASLAGILVKSRQNTPDRLWRSL